jgi:hypothetical protein
MSLVDVAKHPEVSKCIGRSISFVLTDMERLWTFAPTRWNVFNVIKEVVER